MAAATVRRLSIIQIRHGRVFFPNLVDNFFLLKYFSMMMDQTAVVLGLAPHYSGQNKVTHTHFTYIYTHIHTHTHPSIYTSIHTYNTSIHLRTPHAPSDPFPF